MTLGCSEFPSEREFIACQHFTYSWWLLSEV